MQVLCAGNPEKKALSQQAYTKKALANERACAIFRADSHRAAASRRVSQRKLS
jgi:hypothetical protein